MARRYGRGPRGQRVDGPVPHGHWKSTTFVGGLTARGFVAPYVTDGAMNGVIFRAWIEQMLAPELRPGDIVGAAQPVAEILSAEDLWVRVYVPEPQLGRVTLGQKVSVGIDSHPERTFSGTVVEIRDRGEYTPRNIQTPETRVDQVFGVKVVVERTPEIKAGMAATVRFEE